MTTLLITGNTRISKLNMVNLLAELVGANRPCIVDPTGSGLTSWAQPDPASCNLVAMLNVHLLTKPGLQVTAASSWCAEHGKAFWMVDKDRATIERAGVSLDESAAELQFANVGDPSNKWLTLIRDGQHTPIDSDNLLEVAAESMGGALVAKGLPTLGRPSLTSADRQSTESAKGLQ